MKIQNAFLRFHASDMVLNVDSDAAYLVQPEAKVVSLDIFIFPVFPDQPIIQLSTVQF